jgi:hypothetical protein
MNCLVLFLTVTSALLPPGPLDGYRHPEWQTFVVGLSNANLSAHADAGSESWGISRLGVTPCVEFRQSGEKIGLWAQLSAQLSATPFDARRQPSSIYYTSSQSSAAWLSLSSAASWFPYAVPLGIHYTLSAGTGGSAKSDAWVWPESSRTIYHSRISSTSLLLSVGPSFGRVRDASPLLAALRAQEILREEGLLDRDLPRADIEELGRRLARRDYWSSAVRFDRTTRYWFDDIESFIRTRLRAGVSIPARVWFRIRDAANSASPVYAEQRLTGVMFVPWVGISAERRHQHEEWTQSGGILTDDTTKFEPHVGSLLLEAGYPATTRLYFHFNAGWTPEIEKSPLVSSGNALASVDYLLFDRLDLRATLKHEGSREWGGGWYIDESARIEADWFIEDRLLLTGGARIYLFARRDDEGMYERGRGVELSASFDWRLL